MVPHYIMTQAESFVNSQKRGFLVFSVDNSKIELGDWLLPFEYLPFIKTAYAQLIKYIVLYFG